MIRIFGVALVLLLLAGCSTKETVLPSNAKAFEEEDYLIMKALYLNQLKLYREAAEVFERLYAGSEKSEYLYYRLQMLYDDKAYEAVRGICTALLADSFKEDAKVQRFLINALIQLEKTDAAKSAALKLLQQTKAMDDYLLLSHIYVLQKHYDTALKYLESAYALNFNETILDQMAVVLYVNLQRKKEAISQLESHSRLHGCSKLICGRLAGFYSDLNDIDGMLSTYLRLYETTQESSVAQAIVNIYSYQKDYPNLMQFLERSNNDDELLLRLYINAKAYEKAAVLAEALYRRNGNPLYLGQSAIFAFEHGETKKDEHAIRMLLDTLKKVLKQVENALFLNYMGYLMIDMDINVTKGMEYVERALVLEPNSPYYLDSLAWGYYKQSRCKEAMGVMQEVVRQLGSDDEEVRYHLDAIEQCVKGK